MENYLKLVRQAKQGDVDAFASLYQEVYEDLYRFALYTLRHPADAQDAVGETVADAFASIRRLRSEEAFRGWIFRILSSKCKRCLKRYAGRPVELTEEMAEQLPHGGSADVAEHIQVRQMFWRLEPQDRMILAMHLFAGYTSREIARQMHMNENTVRSRESRALKRMRREMEAD